MILLRNPHRQYAACPLASSAHDRQTCRQTGTPSCRLNNTSSKRDLFSETHTKVAQFGSLSPSHTATQSRITLHTDHSPTVPQSHSPTVTAQSHSHTVTQAATSQSHSHTVTQSHSHTVTQPGTGAQSHFIVTQRLSVRGWTDATFLRIALPGGRCCRQNRATKTENKDRATRGTR
eukprot:scaffold62715_cov63-Phaeocystis_antarctica.AAC.1